MGRRRSVYETRGRGLGEELSALSTVAKSLESLGGLYFLQVQT